NIKVSWSIWSPLPGRWRKGGETDVSSDPQSHHPAGAAEIWRTGPDPPVGVQHNAAGTAADRSRQAHRCIKVHRLQSMSGGLYRMERYASRNRRDSGGL